MLVKLTPSLIRNTIIHLCNLKPVHKCQYWTISPMVTFFSLNIWYFSHKIIGLPPSKDLDIIYGLHLGSFFILEKSLCFLVVFADISFEKSFDKRSILTTLFGMKDAANHLHQQKCDQFCKAFHLFVQAKFAYGGLV